MQQDNASDQRDIIRVNSFWRDPRIVCDGSWFQTHWLASVAEEQTIIFDPLPSFWYFHPDHQFDHRDGDCDQLLTQGQQYQRYDCAAIALRFEKSGSKQP